MKDFKQTNQQKDALESLENIMQVIQNNKELYDIYTSNMGGAMATTQQMGLMPGNSSDREDLRHIFKLVVSYTISDMLKCQLAK